MSDSTSEGGDFRGSREEKRKDETVMVNSESLSEMVTSAKEAGAAATNFSAAPADADDELADSQFGRIVVIVGIIALVIAVAIITYVNLFD